MKKYGKYLLGSVALASIAAGAYYVYKNYIKKDTSDDFEDFDDDYEDFDTEEDEDEEESKTDSRGYVPINHSTGDSKKEDKTGKEADIPGDDAAEEENEQ